ncbi:hypothetical protein [Lachnoclostridium phytofermentans]|uniref:hypothetical protein n=1 Tax=Lachnoclostridium phytofermentans TaxID=66219 RepID=UPI000AD0A3C3|nr:hypothetical protein [Lachnoclostridium phytofermentans]
MQKSEQNLKVSLIGSMKLATKTIRPQSFCVSPLQRVLLLTMKENTASSSMKLILSTIRQNK